MRRETEDRRDRRAGLTEADRRLGVCEQDRFVDDGDLVAVVVTGREAPAAVAEAGVVVRLVHRLPPADEIAERLGHEVDMAGPGVRTSRFPEEAAFGCEPARQREVVEADPWRDAGVTSGSEHGAVVLDGAGVVHTGFGFDARPFDRQPMVGEAEAREQPKVLRVPSGETVAVARDRRSTCPFPVPPVRCRCGALALCRRRAGAPHEIFGPSPHNSTLGSTP